MQYNETTYGSGGVSAGPLVAIPSQGSHYFTAGKVYPIVGHHAWTYIVLCDKGHQRVISMESGARSAHLPGTFDSDPCGTFEIRTA